jgi:serine protease
MKKALILAIAAAAFAPAVMALHNYNLEQKNAFLPRDQYLNLTDPEKVNTQHVVIQFIEDTRVRLQDGRLVSLEGLNLDKFNDFIARHPEMRLRRNITVKTVEEVDAWIARGEELSGIDLVDMNNFYTIEIHGNNPDPKGLLQELLSDPMVETVYYHPWVQLATCNADIAPTTGNYEASQDYLNPAPEGVDMAYAYSFDPTYANGTSGNWIVDIENDWCSNHEDMNDNLVIYNWDGTNNDADGDHGTAVLGIVGACDNGFGITGMVSDNTMKGWSWSGNGDPYPDVSNSIAGVDGPMITGDTYLIEIHAPGPTQGTTCTCNCSQFEYIAMEYWAANFNAIVANGANGLYCAQAAGNGSMNLDSGVYGGAFNRNVRDSGAVIIGAATDDATHDPTCWTNHGTRIDVYGWGQGVETLGYGDRFDGVAGSCRQEYTASFSGTSSATPIVAGTMASLALIHRYGDAAAWMSPTSLRSRLQINGTPQATDFTP